MGFQEVEGGQGRWAAACQLAWSTRHHSAILVAPPPSLPRPTPSSQLHRCRRWLGVPLQAALARAMRVRTGGEEMEGGEVDEGRGMSNGESVLALIEVLLIVGGRAGGIYRVAVVGSVTGGGSHWEGTAYVNALCVR